MAARTGDRRIKLRQATIAEIRATARRLLVDKGPSAVTINAVASQMSMSGPAVYHYFANHDALVDAMTAEFFDELAEHMDDARKVDHKPDRRLMAACRAMRDWTRAHPAECRWILASPIPVTDRGPESIRFHAARRFEQIFLEEVADIWHSQPFPVRDLAELPPAHQRQLRDYSETMDPPLPPEAAHIFLACWIRLHGLVCLETLHQLDFAYTDLSPVFEECLAELCTMLGIEYEPPEP